MFTLSEWPHHTLLSHSLPQTSSGSPLSALNTRPCHDLVGHMTSLDSLWSGWPLFPPGLVLASSPTLVSQNPLLAVSLPYCPCSTPDLFGASLAAIPHGPLCGLLVHAFAAHASPWPCQPCTATGLFGPCQPHSHTGSVIALLSLLCPGFFGTSLSTISHGSCRGLVGCTPPRSSLWYPHLRFGRARLIVASSPIH